MIMFHLLNIKLLQHTFQKELKVPLFERNILTSDSPLSPKMNKEKMAQIMFEKINVQGLFICIRTMLLIYCVVKTSALVVESGDDIIFLILLQNQILEEKL